MLRCIVGIPNVQWTFEVRVDTRGWRRYIVVHGMHMLALYNRVGAREAPALLAAVAAGLLAHLKLYQLGYERCELRIGYYAYREKLETRAKRRVYEWCELLAGQTWWGRVICRIDVLDWVGRVSEKWVWEPGWKGGWLEGKAKMGMAPFGGKGKGKARKR